MLLINNTIVLLSISPLNESHELKIFNINLIQSFISLISFDVVIMLYITGIPNKSFSFVLISL